MADGAGVVNFASVDAFTVTPGQLLYGASKADTPLTYVCAPTAGWRLAGSMPSMVTSCMRRLLGRVIRCGRR
jgi:hypothetical protein